LRFAQARQLSRMPKLFTFEPALCIALLLALSPDVAAPQSRAPSAMQFEIDGSMLADDTSLT